MKNESKPEVRLAQFSTHIGDGSSLFHDQQWSYQTESANQNGLPPSTPEGEAWNLYRSPAKPEVAQTRLVVKPID